MDININVGGTITLTADKLLAALSGTKVQQEVIALPQTPAEQATRQRVEPAPTYATPVAPAVPVQSVNPTSAQPVQTPASVPVMVAQPTAPTVPVAPQTPAVSAPVAPAPQQAPIASAPTYQLDDLARASAQLMDAGKQQDLLALLAQFQVPSLGQLTPDKFGAFATALRQLGAKL